MFNVCLQPDQDLLTDMNKDEKKRIFIPSQARLKTKASGHTSGHC